MDKRINSPSLNPQSSIFLLVLSTQSSVLNPDTSVLLSMRSLQSMKRHFLTGLFVLVPAYATFLILQTLIAALDALIRDFFGPAVALDFRGLGILTLVCLILLTGIIATQFLGQRVLRWTEERLERIPIVRSVYLTLKGMTDVFKFRERFGHSKVVMFPFPRHGLWALGFFMGVAQPALQVTPNGPLAMVFVPTAIHPFTGYLAFMPQSRLLPVNLPPEEAMKMEFSAGLYRPRSEWLKRVPPPTDPNLQDS